MRRSLVLVALGLLTCTAIGIACVSGDETVRTRTDGDDDDASAPTGNADGSIAGDDDDTPTGSDGGAPDAAPPFSPKDLAGLRLWLEASQGLTRGAGLDVLSWTDISGRWADAGADAGTPDGGAHRAVRLDVVGPGYEANSLGGLPALSFSTSRRGFVIPGHPDFNYGKGDFVTAIVVKQSAGTDPVWSVAFRGLSVKFGGFLYATADAGRTCTSLNAQLGDFCTPPKNVSAGPHVLVARRKGDELSVRVDGDVVSAQTITDETAGQSRNDADIYLGDGISGFIPEVVFLVGPTTDADLAKLEAHFATKYAIP